MNKKFKVGLIRVLTTEDEEVLQSHGKQIMEYFPELEVVTKCIPDQYEGIHSPELGEIAIPKIVETARSFTDVDMIIVSCADDPGVAEIRKVLPDIPVTGGGETTVALALKYGSRIGVLGITDYAPQAYMRMIPEQMILGRPEGVHSTLDLMTPEGKASVLKLGMKLKEQGAEVIALACTGLARPAFQLLTRLWQKVCLLISNISEKNKIAQTSNNRLYAARKVIKICY